MLKKFIISICILLSAALSISSISAGYVHAEEAEGGGQTSTIPTNPTPTTGLGGRKCPTFLGMVSWDCGINNIDSEESLKANIWTIAANIASAITVLASYLIIAYVIYGGYLYMFSSGDSGKVATGKKALAQGFIGLGIVMSANLIMSTIRFVIMGGNGALSTNVDPDELFISAINWVITIAGIVSVAFLVYGGILYITSTGDPSKIKKAKDVIKYSLIGLAIVALATTITAVISNTIRDANKNSYIKSLISKEVYEIKNN